MKTSERRTRFEFTQIANLWSFDAGLHCIGWMLADKINESSIDPVERGHPGIRTTDMVDFHVVVFDEVYLELDDGVEALLHQP